jgi:hypothetical protein
MIWLRSNGPKDTQHAKQQVKSAAQKSSKMTTKITKKEKFRGKE